MFQSFITKEQIQERILKLGQQITEDYKGEEIIVAAILNGSFMFCEFRNSFL